MTDQDILKKAIEKAVKNGMPTSVIDKGTFYQLYWAEKGRDGLKVTPKEFSPEDCYGLIFSHDFAKALCKDTQILGKNAEEMWKAFLKEMVLKENPIQYIEQFLQKAF